MPDDYTKSTETLMFEEELVTVIINPCTVLDYSLTSAVQEINYYIGTPGFTDGSYIFDESPVCNYPETVIISNLPSFMTHDENNSDFTI